MRLAHVLAVCVWTSLVSGSKIPNLLDNHKYTDCNDVRDRGGHLESGVYTVHVNGSQPFQVECRFEFNKTTAYQAILVQKYGQESFHRPYTDYVNGFGSASAGDYWMGLGRIKHLTDTGFNVLTVTLQDWAHNIKRIQYRYFQLGEASDRYRLYIGGYASGAVLPDDLSFNNGLQFATYDYPDQAKCAVQMRAGWWFNYCTYTLPTGQYYRGGPYTPSGGYYDGIFYKDWLNYGYSLKYISLELSTI